MKGPLFRPGALALAWLVAAGAVMSARAAATAEPRVHVYAVRGFAGAAFSRGLNQLCDELAHTPHVACTVDDFYNEAAITRAASAASARGERLVLVGHSLGAHTVLRVGAAVNTEVPLIVSIDPNWFPDPPTVPANADLVLNYYQDFDLLGRARLQAPEQFRGQLLQFVRKEPHVMIDRSSDIHAEIARRIQMLLTALDAPAPRPAERRARQRGDR
ncbi:MAG TPA: alpha/beta fold hydrolase [Xanthobacteraceae bacterium]|nr:alpha/beta fold hydrolase [Xanthobacteraceae bacterium]